jgi:hypothetical protein
VNAVPILSRFAHLAPRSKTTLDQPSGPGNLGFPAGAFQRPPAALPHARRPPGPGEVASAGASLLHGLPSASPLCSALAPHELAHVVAAIRGAAWLRFQRPGEALRAASAQRPCFRQAALPARLCAPAVPPRAMPLAWRHAVCVPHHKENRGFSASPSVPNLSRSYVRGREPYLDPSRHQLPSHLPLT